MSDYYIHNDKDNTSASETANSHADGPNQPDSGRKAGGFNSINQGMLRNKREKYNKNQSDGLLHIPTYADEVDGPDYLDQNNQTVSEILSMLSGSEAQSSDNQIGKLKGSEE